MYLIGFKFVPSMYWKSKPNILSIDPLNYLIVADICIYVWLSLGAHIETPILLLAVPLHTFQLHEIHLHWACLIWIHLDLPNFILVHLNSTSFPILFSRCLTVVRIIDRQERMRSSTENGWKGKSRRHGAAAARSEWVTGFELGKQANFMVIFQTWSWFPEATQKLQSDFLHVEIWLLIALRLFSIKYWFEGTVFLIQLLGLLFGCRNVCRRWFQIDHLG